MTGEGPHAAPSLLAVNSNPAGGIRQQLTAPTQIEDAICAPTGECPHVILSNSTGWLALSRQRSGPLDSSTMPYGPLAGGSTRVPGGSCVTASAQRGEFESQISSGSCATTVDVAKGHSADLASDVMSCLRPRLSGGS